MSERILHSNDHTDKTFDLTYTPTKRILFKPYMDGGLPYIIENIMIIKNKDMIIAKGSLLKRIPRNKEKNGRVCICMQLFNREGELLDHEKIIPTGAVMKSTPFELYYLDQCVIQVMKFIKIFITIDHSRDNREDEIIENCIVRYIKLSGKTNLESI